MISIDEVRDIAGKVSLQNMVVEKDYALGWLLWGIGNHKILSKEWVFKGGTCLKKCYFETYRFSEDLDFSFIGKKQPTADGLVAILEEIADAILEEAGLEFTKSTIKFEEFKNPRGTLSIQGGIKFRGPVRPQVGAAHQQRIKIDLTLDEPLVHPAVSNQVSHVYSDKPDSGIYVLSYDYEEIFAEKIRAMAQRMRPRDLYDVVHLYRRNDLNTNREKIRETLQEKCNTRGIAFPTVEFLQTHDNRSFVESEWATQLKHQIPILPSFTSFFEELPAVFSWLLGEAQESLKRIETGNEKIESVQKTSVERANPQYLPGSLSTTMDKIRFAAANRLVIRLTYDGSARDIEPYSFARSKDGALLLQAIRHDSGEVRSYRTDRIQGVQITESTFAPRYSVEITSTGQLPVHNLQRSTTTSPPSVSRTKPVKVKAKGPSNRVKFGGGLTYVYKCPVCQREFRRKTNSSALNKHKSKQGYVCPGRVGYFIRIV